MSALPRLDEIARLAADLAAGAARAHQRRALVLCGEPAWSLEAGCAALSGAALDDVLWVSGRAPAGAPSVAASHAHQVLGRDVDGLVFDAFSGFDPDAFGAASGAVRGGGLLLLLTPALAQWPGFNDPDNARMTVSGYRPDEVTGRFLRRLVRIISCSRELVTVTQGAPLPALTEGTALPPLEQSGPTSWSALDLWCHTSDQRQAVEAILHVVYGHRRRPVVLTSDRGRGKSAALGIAAAQLLRHGAQRVLVTGPRLDSVEPVFAHAHRLLPEATASRAAIHFEQRSIEFASPDDLALNPHTADLLLVDEAAAIPTPLLERLLRAYPRIAFATTVHGYEGTGRGFAVRFHKFLDKHSRGWRTLRLETPIRWAPGDPVERFAFRALLLDASAAPDSAIAQADATSVTVQRLDRDRLVDDEKTLSELFGLLVLAHYRTRPNDLRHLLDGPNLSLHVVRYDEHVVGAVVVAREGGLDADTSTEVWAGRARPHGHLIPESVAAHVGLERAPRLTCARIMRIAVHPAVQGRGLGTGLVQTVMDEALAEGLDYVGASFGATEELLRFWGHCGFFPVRLSVKRGATSGAHSAIFLKPLSEAGGALCAEARERFLEHFPHQLGDPLRDLEPGLGLHLLRRDPGSTAPLSLTSADWRELAAFAFGQRIYEVCIAPLWKLACAALGDPRHAALITAEGRRALVLKVLQKRSWQDTAVVLGVAGRSDVVERLRQAVQPLVVRLGDADAHRAVRQLHYH